ncbi:MAG TPA: hypothetical protein VK277_16090 [Acidimicrobiales bacterium]|nr:hypothetical protein [Acidimicrobiales bacterium]
MSTLTLEHELDAATARLEGIESESQESSAADHLSEIMAIVAGINHAMHADMPDAPLGSLNNDVLKKLKEWLDKLVGALRTIVKQHAAASFSITVGLTVSVTVAF